MDALFFAVVSAAGIVGWFLCYRNPRVNVVWRWVAIPSTIFLSAYLLYILLYVAQATWWTGATMDRPLVAMAIGPILAWPIRSHKPPEAGDGGALAV